MTTMIERVARALCEERTWVGAWTSANEVERNAWLWDARAAIAAMREPTEEMENAAYRGASLEEGSSAYGCWRAMIDNALEEGE